MIRPRTPHRLDRRAWPILLAFLVNTIGVAAMAQTPPVEPEKTPAQFFPVTEPITSETVARIRAATRQLVDSAASAAQGKRPILVFEFRPGNTAPGTSEYGGCHDLANLISRELTGAKLTVAYIPEPLKGYAVLPAVACTEIVMGSSATLGPITPDGQAFDAADEGYVRFLAIRKTRDPDLLVGMLNRDADLRLIHTADKTAHYVLAPNLPGFKKTHQEVVEDQPAWEDGLRGVLTAKRAREEGFCTRFADSTTELANIYQIAGESAVDDPILGRKVIPVWIPLEGPLDNVMFSYVTKRVEQAREEKANLLIIQINSPGGNDTVTDRLADFVAGIKDMKTVAYIEDRAVGLAALLPLACRDIVFKKGSRMGDVRQVISGRSGPLHDLTEGQIAGLAGKAEVWARLRGHPEAVARAMVDPEAEILEALDSKTGATRLILRTDLAADPGRYQVIRTRKDPGSVLTVEADEAESYGRLGRVVNDAEELKDLYGLHGRDIRMEGPGWVDSFVEFLTEPVVSWLLLFLGVFMMVVELKLPGIGLPGIISALAFLLFFWSHYLSGTADQLEIILFLIGLVCLAVELFVFPGMAIFGLSGILLMLCSIVMASHTFIWPTQEYEYRELGYTLMQVTGMLFAVGVGAAILARYIPSMPVFNRLILKPEPWTPVEGEESATRAVVEGYESLNFLVGETGRSTTPLRPTGKARFGNLHIDVMASNGFVEPDTLIEVVDVQGARVIVKKV
jgi:membrane-bound serine protease (ClpP class)